MFVNVEVDTVGGSRPVIFNTDHIVRIELGDYPCLVVSVDDQYGLHPLTQKGLQELLELLHKLGLSA